MAGPTIPKFDETEGSFKSGFRTYYDSFSTSDTDDSAGDNDSYRSKMQSSEETDNKESYRREEKSYKTKKRTTKHTTTGEQIQRESRERKLFGLFSFYIHRSEIDTLSKRTMWYQSLYSFLHLRKRTENIDSPSSFRIIRN